MRITIRTVRQTSALLVACTTLVLPGATEQCVAQSAAAQSATFGDLKLSWEGKGVLGPRGATVEGNVVANSPELYVAAQRAEFKRAGNQLQEVRAQTNVTLKANLAAPGTGAPARIEATSDVATYDHANRKVTLRGKVNGWYETAKNGRSKLRTDMVVLYRQGENLMIDLTGGVHIAVPAEATGAITSIGAVTITSRDASIDESKGIARFVGSARAFSDDTPNKFDVTAPEFVVTRSAAGTIDTIKTTGRTLVKMDVPPDPTPPATTATTAAGSTPGAGDNTRAPRARPTHVEVSADSAVVTRATSTLVFNGNVKGFYELAPTDEAPQRYPFAGDRAVLTYVLPEVANAEREAGLYVEITGVPGVKDSASIAFPTFDTADLKNKK